VGECGVEIRIHDSAGEPAEVQPGETMRFTVTVTTDKEVRVGLDVFSAVESRGKGFGLELEGFRLRLFEGTLPMGTHAFEGSAKAPLHPSSYDGEHIGIDWWLHAVADIPWAKDPKAQAPFRLAPPPGIELELPEPEGPEDVARHRTRFKRWERNWLLFGGVALLATALSILLAKSGVEPELFHGLVIPGGMLGLGGFFPALIAVLWRTLRGGRQAPIAVAVALAHQSADGGYRAVQPQRGITCTAFVETGKRIDELKGIIEVDEWAEWSEGTKESRSHHSVRRTQYRRAVDMKATDEPGHYRCVLPLPKQTYPATVTDSGGHGIQWIVRIHVRHSGGKEPLDPIVRLMTARPIFGPAAPTG